MEVNWQLFWHADFYLSLIKIRCDAHWCYTLALLRTQVWLQLEACRTGNRIVDIVSVTTNNNRSASDRQWKIIFNDSHDAKYIMKALSCSSKHWTESTVNKRDYKKPNTPSQPFEECCFHTHPHPSCSRYSFYGGKKDAGKRQQIHWRKWKVKGEAQPGRKCEWLWD